MSPEGQCFHCGLPVPAGVDFSVQIDGAQRKMCCHGCQAVAQAIVDNGLEEYYRHRTAMPGRAEDLVPEELRKLTLYDHPEIQKSFVLESDEHTREAVLILEGITCAACIWLNERHLMQLPGVRSVQVNYATHRARIRWDNSQIQLSRILSEIQLLGYNAHPYNAHSSEALRKKQRRLDLRRLSIAGLSAAQVMMLAVALYAGASYGMEASTANLLRFVSLALTLPVMFYAAVPLYRGAWSALRTRRLNMDVPVVLAIIGAFVGSAWVTLRGHGVVYFDAITMFTLFLLATRFLEQGARERSVQAAENLLKLAPAMATRIQDGEQTLVPVADLRPGEIILVKPGEAIAADAVVAEGESSTDESLLTGESRPVPKTHGDKVVAGSINLEGPLRLEVTGVGENTVLAGIVRMLDQAQAAKPRIAQVADRVASRFTGGLLLLTVGTGAVWWLLDPSRVFETVLAVLVVTCPCALSIAAPAAMAAAGSRLLGRGVLLTRGHALEALAQVNRVVFDKTGTLTHGRPMLERVATFGQLSDRQVLLLAASLEQASEHPLAASFVGAVGDAKLHQVDQPQNVPGRGVSGLIGGTRYFLGNARLIEGPKPVPDDAPAGSTVVWLSDGEQVLAAFVITDALRSDAAELVRQLKADGMQLTILSGDAEPAVRHVAQQLGIEDYRAALHPEDKLAALQQMQQRGDVVAMVGDGVNDAPVLAGAQVSLAMGGGTQVARASSDIVLLSERLPEIADALHTGKSAMSIVRQNFIWAIGYNLLALPFAMMGFVAPWLAALGMSTSSLVVVLNALRLR
jgi:Cu2+-exporting ATPase